MMTTDSIVAEAKPRRRASVQKSARPAVQKVKMTICLDPETARRLGIHAVMSGRDRSEVVDELIRTHCKRFVVSDRGGCDNGSIGEAAMAS